MSLSLTNDRVQRLRRLLGRRSFRADEGALVVEGAKVLEEALDAGADVECVFVEEGADNSVLERASARGIRVHTLASGVAARVGDTIAPQPVFAVLRWRTAEIDVLRRPLETGGFVLVGAGVQDPGNAGTIIRSAEGAGAAGVILCDGSVDATNPKTVRSSAGALFHVPIVQETRSAVDVVAELQAWGTRCWATSSVVDGHAYDRCDLTGSTAIVVGNEANGLHPEVLRRVDGLLTIPMAGQTESLNVGMATAVLAFEAARQRRHSSMAPTP